MAELDVQPFGISVCEESDRIIVTGSIPYRRAVPFTAKFNRLYVYLAASGEVQRVVSLDDSYEIPRHALAIGQHFVVCYGWTKYGKVVKTFHLAIFSVTLLHLLLLMVYNYFSVLFHWPVFAQILYSKLGWVQQSVNLC